MMQCNGAAHHVLKRISTAFILAPQRCHALVRWLWLVLQQLCLILLVAVQLAVASALCKPWQPVVVAQLGYWYARAEV
jgi:hypothetical protein